MHRFIHRHTQRITGILSGFDRLVFRGTLRQITHAAGMFLFLCYRRILLKEFGEFAQSSTDMLRNASLEAAMRFKRPVLYLSSPKTDKETTARSIASRDGIREGLVCVLEAVEPCRSFEIFRNRDRKQLQLVSRWRKCKFLYHYLIDPIFGFMSARIQTWFPFDVQLCLNGREWLARALDAASIGYERRDNCFTAIDNLTRAQNLMDRQLRIHWPTHLNRIAAQLNPAHDRIFRDFRTGYYWSVHQSEWATDLMFRDPASLAHIYPGLVRHGMTCLSSGDVMRFLGQKVHGGFKGQIVSDFKDRPEGIRIKHRVNANSIKLYDKQGSVLRAETTINDAAGIKVFRPREGDPQGKPALRPLRRGVADLHRRAQVSHAANGRYLDALASADTSGPASRFLQGLDRPAFLNGQRVRGLRAWSAHDLALFKAVSRGEFSINGFRNVDLDQILNGDRPKDPLERRRRSARTTRQIRLLRAHGLIRKIPRSRRYHLTARGRQILSTVLALHDLTLEELHRVA